MSRIVIFATVPAVSPLTFKAMRYYSPTTDAWSTIDVFLAVPVFGVAHCSYFLNNALDLYRRSSYDLRNDSAGGRIVRGGVSPFGFPCPSIHHCNGGGGFPWFRY